MDKAIELRRKAAEKIKAAGALLSSAGESGLTADQEAEWNKLHEDAKAFQRQAEMFEAQEREAAKTSLASSHPLTASVSVKENFEDDPKKGYKSPREFFGEILSVGLGNRAPSDRLRSLTVGSDEGGTHSNPYGGFLVPTGFSPDLLQVGAEGDPTAGRTMMIPMSTPVIRIPARVDKDHSSSVSGGLRVYRTAETTQATASRQQFEQIELIATDLVGLTFQTEQLIQDSPISVIALIQQGFRDEMGGAILNEKLRGTGAGQLMGIINSPAKVTVSKETNQAADTINYTNVIKMRARSWGYGNAIWLGNHDIIPQLMGMTDGAGQLIWNMNAREGNPDTLLGRPIFFSEFLETLGDEGDLILFNPSQYLEALYQPLQSAESIHVRFEYNERAFKVWVRNAGAPWWRSALTPKKGSNTLSPIVTLQAR